MIRITAVGFGQAGRQLDRENARFKSIELRARMRRAGAILVDEARRIYASSVNQSTGQGRSAIRFRIKSDRRNRDIYGVVEATGPGWYARLLATGTAERRTSSGRRSGRVQGSDFFGRALRNKKGDADRELESAFRVFTG